MEEEQLQITPANLDLETLVSQHTWREVLLEVINSGQMNPWDIDIVLIADKYLQKVRELASVDLRLPANVILASALLLRLKADALSLEEIQEEFTIDETPRELIAEEIPQLIARSNKARARKITLEELVKAVEEVISTTTQQLTLPAPKILELEVPKEDLHELIKKIYALANELKNEAGILQFSSLLDPNSIARDKGTHISSRLVPVLHLVQERKVDVWQKELFGEIHIKVL